MADRLRHAPRQRPRPWLLAVLSLLLVLGSGCRRSEQAVPSDGFDRPDVSALPPAFQARLASVEQRLRSRPDSAADWLELGQLYHANRYTAEAETIYARLDGDAPTVDPARLAYYRADLARQRGDLPAAEQFLRRTLGAAPDYQPALLSLGEVLYKSSRADEAQDAFEAVLANEPGQAHASLALARDELRRGEREAARARLERLAVEQPGFTEGLFLLAQLLEREGDAERAAALREQGKLGWDLPPADPWIEALRAYCYDPQQLSIWFEDLKRVGRAAEGLPYLRQIEELDPANPQPHLQRATLALQQQQLETAADEFRRAAEKDAEPTLLYPAWLQALVALGRWEELEQVARRGLERAPQTPVIHTTLGGLRLRQGDFAGAVAQFQQALAVDPQHDLTHQLLANAYLARGDAAAATPHLEMLVRLNPRDASARRLLAQQRLDAQDLAGAIPLLVELLRIEPDEEVRQLLVRCHLGLAEAARGRGNLHRGAAGGGRRLGGVHRRFGGTAPAGAAAGGARGSRGGGAGAAAAVAARAPQRAVSRRARQHPARLGPPGRSARDLAGGAGSTGRPRRFPIAAGARKSDPADQRRGALTEGVSGGAGAQSSLRSRLSPRMNIPPFLSLLVTAVVVAPLLMADAKAPRRFFADDSFWNQPIPADAKIDPRTERWIQLLESEPTSRGFIMNSQEWTIPVYEVDETTPVHPIGRVTITPAEKIRWHTDRDTFGHGPGFGAVPLPPQAVPDAQFDAHLAVVDWKRNLVWDMWALSRNPDGSWRSATGMVYAADGPGVFSTAELGVQDGESVHFYGPSRAAGVPAVAGLIRYDEVAAGEIRHKVAAASRFCAYKEFVFPAAWTDGFTEGGIPQGTVIQLDPNLDLAQFQLTREERVVCVALQRYGMVLVDIAQGQPLYAEGLWAHPGRSWDGKLPHGENGISRIPFRHYRMIQAGPATFQGDGRSKHAPVWETPEAVQP
jgi:tetratricopeptide (TPR) repeat protein